MSTLFNYNLFIFPIFIYIYIKNYIFILIHLLSFQRVPEPHRLLSLLFPAYVHAGGVPFF